MSQIELTFLLPPLNFLIFLFSYFGKLPTHFLKSETAFNLHIYLMIESSQFFSLIFLKSITLLLLLFHDHYQTLGLLCGFLQDVPHCVCQKSLEPHSNKYCCHLKKRCTMWECKVSCIWGTVRTAAWETAPQIAWRNCTKKTVGGGQYIWLLVKREFNAIKHLSYKRFSASHEEVMSPVRD